MAQIRLEADRQAPSEARRFVREALAAWNQAELADSIMLAVSELVTNAVLHAHSATSVTLVNCDDVVHLQVRDADPSEPQVRPMDETAVNGRGMQLVGQVSDQWGVLPSPPGKIVWLDITKHLRDQAT